MLGVHGFFLTLLVRRKKRQQLANLPDWKKKLEDYEQELKDAEEKFNNAPWYIKLWRWIKNL